MQTPLSIYIHIPFCPTKCLYCDFLSFTAKTSRHAPYVAALCNHIRTHAPNYENYLVKTIFLGGGTPTSLAPHHLAQILDTIKSHYNLDEGAVISTEANPETVDAAYLTHLRHIGFNRISLGVQSFDDNLLSAIGRIHTANKAVEVINRAAAVGFTDINIDLIFALPYQALSHFEKTLNIATDLPITHISCYALTPEDGTPLINRKDLLGAICNDETDRAMYHAAATILARAGFNHYEISNWAKPDHVCNHNIGYWTNRQYVGFGIGAHSYIDNTRFRNTHSLNEYIAENFAPHDTEAINTTTAMTEFMILGLRLTKGISAKDFTARFNEDIFAHYADILPNLQQHDLITINTDNIRLTKKGLDLANTVFTHFV